MGHVPTKQLIALLNSTSPAQAVSTIFSMTADRIAVLLTEMDPAHIARMLVAASGQRKADLFAAIPPDRASLVLQELSVPQFASFLSAVPAQMGAQVLHAGSPRWAAHILRELPPETRSQLLSATTNHTEEFSSAVYERGVTESIVRIVARASWLDQRTCDLLAEVFDKNVHIAVRYQAGEFLTGAEVDEVAARADWRYIAGLVVVTNAALADSAEEQAKAIQYSGRELKLLHWTDERDDGALKRALVRLAG